MHASLMQFCLSSELLQGLLWAFHLTGSCFDVRQIPCHGGSNLDGVTLDLCAIATGRVLCR